MHMTGAAPPAPAAGDALQALAGMVARILLEQQPPRQVAWSKAKAAGMLDVTESWLEEMARQREIPFTKLGGAYHFTDAHLAEITRTFEVLPAGKPQPAVPEAKAPRVRRGPSRSDPAPATAPVVQLQARQPRPRRTA